MEQLRDATTGAAVGFLFGALNLVVGALGNVYATIRGHQFDPEPGLWSLALLYLVGFTCAGAVVGLLAPGLMRWKGGYFVLCTIGATVVFFFIETARRGAFLSWTGEAWALVLGLGLVYGMGLGFALRWLATRW